MNTERLTEDALAEKRYASRKAVSLSLNALIDGEQRRVAVRDLSHTGFLVDTMPSLTLDQAIELELPNAGRKTAKVVWAGDALAGCTFLEPISKAELSGALLKSGFLQAPVVDEPQISEPIAYAAMDEAPGTPLPVWARLVVIGGASALAWTPILLVGSLFIG